DRGIWPWDQACYALASVDLWWTLLHDPASYFSYISEAVLRCRAPGISVIGQFFVPLGQTFGSIERFLLLSIFIQSYLCLFLLGATIQRLETRSRLCPYLAILILAATPLFADMSRTFLVEQLQLLSVIYVYWVLVGFEDRGASASFSHLLIAVSLGLAAKISSPLYCLVPACFVLYKLIRRPLIDLLPGKLRERILALVAAAFLLPVAFWYVHNLEYVLFAARDLSVGTMAGYYGSAEPIPQKLIHWIQDLARFSLVPAMYYLLPLLVVIPLYLKFKEKSLRSGIMIAAVLQSLVVLLVLSLSVPEDVRYVYGILPSLIVVYTVLVSTIRNQIYLVSALAVFLIQFIAVSLSSFGNLQNGLPLLTRYINHETKILSLPGAKVDELNRLVRLAAASYREGYRIVLGVNYPWLNPNTLGFYAARAKLDGLNWFSIESWKVDMQESELPAWFSTRKKVLFITLSPRAMDEEKSVPFANRLNKSALEYVEVRGKKIPFESDSGLLIYKIP
ncbi:MAG: hypothetical protein KC652_25885, partial [Cyanobacteria bacterium HKST-UBA01]|nr:hypothetical protein [Cyanobacteria bacterium HKST-UBA01]